MKKSFDLKSEEHILIVLLQPKSMLYIYFYKATALCSYVLTFLREAFCNILQKMLL